MAPTPSYYGPGSSQGGGSTFNSPIRDQKESPPSYTHPRNNPQSQFQPQAPLQVYNNHAANPNPNPPGVYEHYSQDYNNNSKPAQYHGEGKYARPGGPPPPPSSYGGGGGGQQENLAFYTGTSTSHSTSGLGTRSDGYYTETSGRRVRRKEEKKRGKDVAVGCCAGCAAACCCCGACVVM